MAFFKEIWKDPVWSKVIAGIILILIGTIATDALNLWPEIQWFLKLIWSSFTSSTSIPNWLFILMAIPCLLVFGAVFFWLKEKSNQGSCASGYVKDNFAGLTWGWSYLGQHITNLHCLCPECQYQIIPKQMHNYQAGGYIYEYSCEECGYKVQPVSDNNGLEQKIKLKIQKKLRTGEWTV
jgi:predicted RNA-binding Zn-ribbon protein involved in translation (DUF1610 family)